MPSLKHLIEELSEMGVDPRRVKLTGQSYDEIVEQVEEDTEENPDE